MDAFLEWIASLPLAALYLALGTAAAVENIFPPLPADTVVAFGSFLAARGQGSATAAFLSTWIGNLVGASIMYAAGRRYGPPLFRRWYPSLASGARAERLTVLYGKYGLLAIFASRFLPGVRALVPPFAGAIRVSFLPAIAAMGVASGIWYGIVTYVAFRVGQSWEDLVSVLEQLNRTVALSVAVLLIIVLVVLFTVRKRRGRSPSEDT